MEGGTSTSALGQRNKYEQDFIENKAKQVALSDKSPEYKQVFSKRLSEIGFNPIKIKQVMNDAEEGKKLIQKNTPSPYQQPGLPVDANKQNYDLGRGYLLTGDNDKAIQHFTESLSNLPESEMQKPERQVMQSGDESVMYSGATQFPAEKNPANALSSIGLAYQNKGDIANAQNFYIQAISHDEGNANALLGLADTYKKQGDINESNDLINRAAQSYKKQALATQIEADKQDDTRKQHEADYMNTIADGLEKFIQGDPNGDLGVLGKLTPWGFVYHNVKEMGLGALQGAKNIVEGAEKSMYVPGQKLDATGGAAQELAGAGELYMSLNPEIAIINSIIQPINEAAQANPENKALNYTSKAISAVFAPAHTIADLLNMKPEEGSTADFLLQSGDVIGFILGAKGFQKIKDAKSSISTLKDLAKEAEQTKDLQKQEEIKAQAKAITDGINSITVDELQQTAKQLGKDKVVEAIDKMTTEKESAAGSDLHEKANQLKNDLANPELTDLHPDIAQNLETVNNEIANQEITNAEKTSIDAEKQSELEGLNKQLLDETITPATKEIINNKIKQLNKEGYAIQKPSTERNVPLPGATGETITEGGEGVRQGIKGDEVAKEGEEKVVAQTEDLEELDFLKLKDDNGTATESEKNRIAELEQKINPTEKPIEKAKLSTIKEPSEKIVEPTQKEHTKESTHALVKNYNELSYREKQSKEGQELKAKIGQAIKDLGYSLKSRAKGKFSLLDEKGVEYRRKAIVREASEIQKEKQAKKRKKSLLNRAPDSVEEAILQDIANGVKFDKKEFTEITGLSGDDIPLGLLKEGGKRIEEYNQNVAERQGNLEDYGDTDMQQMSKIADTISEYATNDRRERAYKALDEMEQRRINHGMTDKELEHYIENQKLSYLEESDVDEILHSVDFMTDKEIESLIKDIEESETDIEKETKIQEHENEIRKPSEQEEISGVNAKNKKQSIKEGEKETLKNVVADKKAKMQSAENKYQKAKAELEKKGQEDQINIFGETPGEAKLFKEDLSASKKVVEDYKNEYLDAKKEYEKSQKDLDNYVEPNQLSISEQAKVIADNIRKGKIDGTMTAPPLLKQAWNGGLELAAKAIEAGGTVTEAIAKAIEHFKNSDYYKSLSESGKKRLVEHLEETLDANKSKEHKLFDRIDELSKEPSNKDRAEIKKIYQENPKVEEINRNFKKIISQLEGTEEFKKSDGCP